MSQWFVAFADTSSYTVEAENEAQAESKAYVLYANDLGVSEDTAHENGLIPPIDDIDEIVVDALEAMRLHLVATVRNGAF